MKKLIDILKEINDNNKDKKDWYFGAEEALKMKVIDQII